MCDYEDRLEIILDIEETDSTGRHQEIIIEEFGFYHNVAAIYEENVQD